MILIVCSVALEVVGRRADFWWNRGNFGAACSKQHTYTLVCDAECL
jgi:hypothetical protein